MQFAILGRDYGRMTKVRFANFTAFGASDKTVD